MAMSADEIKRKSAKADEIFSDAMSKLREIKKKQNKIIAGLIEKTEVRKIDKVRKEIEGL